MQTADDLSAALPKYSCGTAGSITTEKPHGGNDKYFPAPENRLMVQDKVPDYFRRVTETGRISENNYVCIGKQTVKPLVFYRKRLIVGVKIMDKRFNTMFRIPCSAEI
jgi:hypothetical protein